MGIPVFAPPSTIYPKCKYSRVEGVDLPRAVVIKTLEEELALGAEWHDHPSLDPLLDVIKQPEPPVVQPPPVELKGMAKYDELKGKGR